MLSGGQPRGVGGQVEGDRSCGGQEALMEAGEWVHGGWGGEVGEGKGVAGSL